MRNEEVSTPRIITDKIALPVLPLKNIAIMPNSIIPIVVGRRSSIEAVEAALKEQRMMFVTAQRDGNTEHPSMDDVFSYGTRSTILQVARMPKGGFKIIVEGINRSQIVAEDSAHGYLRAWCSDIITEQSEHDIELEATWRTAQALYGLYRESNNKVPADLLLAHATPSEMEQGIDTIIIHLNISLQDRQEFLEIKSLKKRILKVCAIFEREIAIAQTEERIRGRVQTQVDKNQKEYYLNEQMKAISKELGRDDQVEEMQQLKAKLKQLKLNPDITDKIDKELRRLEQMPPASAEGAVIRHYIDWIFALPWHKLSKDTISLASAEKILDRNHAGLKKPKERILEYIAAKKFTQSLTRSPIICLVGPPGVGKTSLAESIAESLGREFRRISLGGVRDEAEIRGHRRTYIGALPGKLIQAMRYVKTKNPVFLLDEIDKIAQDSGHGDPAAALLEVLDPEQNKQFVDHFIEIPYDLSQVTFITTANHLDGIPYPLHDRMEIIEIPGYSEDEKIEIAQKFLIPRNLKEHGLTAQQCKIPLPIIYTIITEYTRESGVRQLERVFTKLMRKVIQILLNNATRKSIVVTPELTREWLGHPRFKIQPIDSSDTLIGKASGLAWTELGGDLMQIETSIVAGKGTILLTGQLGNVMQESAQAAISYIRSRANELGLKPSFNTTKDIHIHIPDGATPKDGPSAGITMCIALISGLTQSPVDPSVAMTGEITLHGKVLPVGGLKAKILAARQHGIKTVILPQENRPEVEEMLAEIGTNINLQFVKTMDEVLEKGLIKQCFTKAKKTSMRKDKRTGSAHTASATL